MGMFRDFSPKHSKRYFDAGNALEDAVGSYVKEINEGVFPAEKNSFVVDDAVIDMLRGEYK
jgi:3-methyl-2-oxobutanoate hydroxymethyltransferase